jgi:hypothetical protein
MDRAASQRDTLMLVELVNADDVAAELGPASQEMFVDEFETRVRQLGRRRDEIMRVQPTKFCVLPRDVNDRQQIELAGAKLERRGRGSPDALAFAGTWGAAAGRIHPVRERK